MTAPTSARARASDEGVHADICDGAAVRRERTLRTSLAPLDGVVGGFRSSRATLIDSDSGFSSELLHLLCVRSFAELGEEVVWIDGGNTVDPYILSAMCKRMGLGGHEMLSMVSVARAFTAYQLVAVIDDALGDEVLRSSPSTVIVSSVSDMFMDRDMRRSEACQLLRRCAHGIAKAAERNDTITVVTSHTPGRVEPEQRIMAVLRDAFDTVVRMRRSGDGAGVQVSAEGRTAAFTPVPWNQLVLEDFAGGPDG